MIGLCFSFIIMVIWLLFKMIKIETVNNLLEVKSLIMSYFRVKLIRVKNLKANCSFYDLDIDTDCEEVTFRFSNLSNINFFFVSHSWGDIPDDILIKLCIIYAKEIKVEHFWIDFKCIDQRTRRIKNHSNEILWNIYLKMISNIILKSYKTFVVISKPFNSLWMLYELSFKLQKIENIIRIINDFRAVKVDNTWIPNTELQENQLIPNFVTLISLFKGDFDDVGELLTKRYSELSSIDEKVVSVINDYDSTTALVNSFNGFLSELNLSWKFKYCEGVESVLAPEMKPLLIVINENLRADGIIKDFKQPREHKSLFIEKIRQNLKSEHTNLIYYPRLRNYLFCCPLIIMLIINVIFPKTFTQYKII